MYFLMYMYFLLFLANKDKKSCGGSLPRMDQDTCLFPVDEKAVEFYFASDARSVNSTYTLQFTSEQHTNLLRVFFPLAFLWFLWCTI